MPADRPYAAHPVWWVIAISLTAIAINLTLRDGNGPGAALGQIPGAVGVRGIYAFSGQITPATFGVYMVDVDAGTIWCYEYTGSGGAKRLRLVAGRSWIFDRYLEEFHNDGPTVAEVEDLVKQQRSRQQQPPPSEVP